MFASGLCWDLITKIVENRKWRCEEVMFSTRIKQIGPRFKLQGRFENCIFQMTWAIWSLRSWFFTGWFDWNLRTEDISNIRGIENIMKNDDETKVKCSRMKSFECRAMIEFTDCDETCKANNNYHNLFDLYHLVVWFHVVV